MRTTASDERGDRWPVLLLAAVLALATTVLLGMTTGAGVASAATISTTGSWSASSGSAAETRVGVSTSGLILVVGSVETVRPGQRRDEAVPGPGLVSGLGVAAEASDNAVVIGRGMSRVRAAADVLNAGTYEASGVTKALAARGFVKPMLLENNCRRQVKTDHRAANED